jgi:hypothetical protein
MRDVDFMNNVTIVLSNEEMIKTKVVDLEKLYNFVVENFFILINLLLQNVFCRSCLPSGKPKTLGKPSAKNNTRQRASLPSAKKTLNKELVCRVFFFAKCFFGHSAKSFFAECPKNCTRQRAGFR